MARSDYPGAEPFLPEQRSLTTLTDAVQTCRGCDLYEHATQAVFGAGQQGSTLMLVGEQPGDVEDRAGEPFVGPAGRVLAELDLVQPQGVVLLGSTAGKSFFGSKFRVGSSAVSG